MFRLTHLPTPVHIAGLRVVHAVRLRWWRVARRKVRGCRAVVLDHEGRVLLIRHSYGSGHWMLPGGGLDRGEEALPGAVREVAEECGLAIQDAVLLGRSEDPTGLFETWMVAGWTEGTPRVDGREVVEGRFFDLADLPQPIWRNLAERLPEWIRAATAARRPA